MKWVLFLLTLCSCSALQPGCIVQNQGSALVSSVLVAQLQCTNSTQVEADVLAAMEKLNLCPANQKQGPIANSLCPAVTQLAVSFLANKVVPATWECTSANAQAGIQAALQAACQQLPMKPSKTPKTFVSDWEKLGSHLVGNRR